jgi:hypothetical protein
MFVAVEKFCATVSIVSAVAAPRRIAFGEDGGFCTYVAVASTVPVVTVHLVGSGGVIAVGNVSEKSDVASWTVSEPPTLRVVFDAKVAVPRGAIVKLPNVIDADAPLLCNVPFETMFTAPVTVMLVAELYVSLPVPSIVMQLTDDDDPFTVRDDTVLIVTQPYPVSPSIVTSPHIVRFAGDTISSIYIEP